MVGTRRCKACDHDWKLWDKILKFTADPDTGERNPVFGDLALKGFRLRRQIVDFNCPISELDAEDWELLQIISAAEIEYQQWRTWKDKKDSEPK